MAQMTSQTLYQALWNSADILRSKMDASEYKNYLLGLIFYKYLSDRMVVYASDQLEEKTTDLDKAQQIYTDAYNDKDLHDDLISNVSDEFGYHIQPDLTFTALIDKIDHGTFQLEDLSQSSFLDYSRMLICIRESWVQPRKSKTRLSRMS